MKMKEKNKMLKVLAQGETCMRYRAFPALLKSSETCVWYPNLCYPARE